MSEELAKQENREDYEVQADRLIDEHFAQSGAHVDNVDLEEKRIILKEMAQASSRREIIKAINTRRSSLNLPLLDEKFDLFFYKKNYGSLIDTLTALYAENLAKRFRFANRITRIGKLNDIAELVFEHVQELPTMDKDYRDSVRLFSQLVAQIDEQMGKLRVVKIEKRIEQVNATPVIEDAAALQELIRKTLQGKLGQLPTSVDATFSEVTDYDKCEFAEKFQTVHHCWYHDAQCKVQTGDINSCPVFMNRTALRNKDYMTKAYKYNRLSARQIAEMSGCKEVDEKVVERVTNRLRDHGLWFRPAGDPNSRNTRTSSEGIVPPVPSGEVEDKLR